MAQSGEMPGSETGRAEQGLAERKSFDVTNKMVLAIAIPMSLGYLTTPLLGLVDTAVIGQLGDASLIGGLALGTVLVSIFLFSFNFFRSGTVGLTAQAYGAGDDIEIKAALLRALALALFIGVLLIVLTPLFSTFGLWLMSPGETTAQATEEYFKVRMLSSPFTLANYVFFGWFVGINHTRTALVLQILLNGVNIVLSALFVLVFEWGITGVAFATVLAEVLAGSVGMYLAWTIVRGSSMPSLARLGDVKAVKRMMYMNGDILIRSFALLLAFGYFTSQGAKFGDLVLAANAILMHFLYFSGYFLDGLAVAGEQLSGRAIGARDGRAFLRAVKLTTLWSFAVALFISLIYLAVGPFLIEQITTSVEVQQTAKEYFIWAAFIALAGAGAFVMDGVYIGSTWSRHMSVTMVASLIGFFVCWWLVKPYLGNQGLWMALYLFLLLRGVLLALLLPNNVRREFGTSNFGQAIIQS